MRPLGIVAGFGSLVVHWLAAFVAFTPSAAEAACNLIPGTTRTYRGAFGITDRPFARPGDLVEVGLVSACDTISPGFLPAAGDHAVLVVFDPPNGPTNAVVMATNCTPLDAELQACGMPAGRCITVSAMTPPVGLQLFMRAGEARFRFRFPDTDAFVEGPNDEHTFSGPARIAVLNASMSLDCNLLSQPCAAQAGVIACVDTLFELDGTCGTTPTSTFPQFTALPPPNSYRDLCFDPMPPCTAAASELRFTTDAHGNLLMPMDWRGILVGQGVPVARLLRGSSAFERFTDSGDPVVIPGNGFLQSFSTEGGLLPPVFDPQSDPTAVDEATLFGSADAPESVLRVARRSTAFMECSGGSNGGLPCLEAADCPSGSCVATTCSGGSNDGGACSGDAACPDGECGPSLFEFRDRYTSSVGPVVLPRFGSGGTCQTGSNAGGDCLNDLQCPGSTCVGYRLVAQDPVPLEGLNQTAALNAFVVAEEVDGKDLNGDGDETDDVVVLSDRNSGALRDIGAAPGIQGRATVRVRKPPFSFPAVAVEDDIVAFLEAEPLQGDCSTPSNCDQNGDGDTFDTIVRVFRLGAGGASEITLPEATAADADLRIAARAVQISQGQVFFRTLEAAQATQTTIPLTNLGVPDQCTLGGSITPDGRFVAHWCSQAQVVDRDTDGDRIFDEPGATSNEVVSAPNGSSAGSTFGGSAVRLSADGRYAAFSSNSFDLVPGDTNSGGDAFVRDRNTDATVRVSVTTGGGQTTSGIDLGNVDISADGRLVTFTTRAPELVTPEMAASPCFDGGGCLHAYVHDRDFNESGTFDQPGGFQTEAVSRSSSGEFANHSIGSARISGNRRFVTLGTTANNLYPGDPTLTSQHAFARDLNLETTAALTAQADGTLGPPLPSMEISELSEDGRFAIARAFGAYVPNDTNDVCDVYLFDRDSDENGVFDEPGRTSRSRVSLPSNGVQTAPATCVSSFTGISPDGRYVLFQSYDDQLYPADLNGNVFNEGGDMYLHDRLTGFTERMSHSLLEGAPDTDQNVSRHAIYTTFTLSDAPLVHSMVYVRGPDPGDLASDLTGDNDFDDFVLHVLDTTSPSPTLHRLCAATEVDIFGGSAVFLRPESAGASLASECTGGDLTGPDLNSDGDEQDEVVHVWHSAAVTNLKCPATGVAISSGRVAALVSEAGQGASGTEYNGDGDRVDSVVMLHDLSDPAPASCNDWTKIGAGQAAIALDISSSTVAFLSPEGAQGQDLNGDGDQDDTVLQVYDIADGTLTALGAAEDFVLGESLLAFRTREVAEDDSDLNEDGDTGDDVLQVYDVVAGGAAVNTQQAVTPCRLEACDPRLPYRVLNDTVKFLTFESDQAEDLNGDGDVGDLILQSFNLRAAQAGLGLALARSMSAPLRFARTVPQFGGIGVEAAALATLGSVSAGVCTDTGDACAGEESGNCPTGVCFVPPGGCIETIGTVCSPQAPDSCPGAQFCEPNLGNPGQGTCKLRISDCRNDSDCTAPAICESGGQDIQRLTAPLAADGGDVFPSAGRCVEDLGIACANCGPGEFCRDGSCHREQQTCLKADDCSPGAECEQPLMTATARDSDGDELSDPFDNCPEVPNVSQADGDDDGVGDACDAAPCGTVACPDHDSVILPVKPLALTIAVGASQARRTIAVRVRNTDDGEPLGHTVALRVVETDCPAGTVGTPDFDKHTAGAQDEVVLAGSRSAKATLTITAGASAFTSFNRRTPTRCTARLAVESMVAGGSSEPSESNNSAVLVIDVIDRNDAEQSATHESWLKPRAPVKLGIRRGRASATKTIRVLVANGDYRTEADGVLDAIQLAVTPDNECPGLTVDAIDCDRQSAGSQDSAGLGGGKRRKCLLTLTAEAAQFSVPVTRSPRRCEFTLRAIGPTEPQAPPLDAGNNAAILSVDVIDRNDPS